MAQLTPALENKWIAIDTEQTNDVSKECFRFNDSIRRWTNPPWRTLQRFTWR
jgi:hypothetical protein